MLDKFKEKRDICYLKSLLIVFGKSTFKICKYMQQNLKLKIGIYQDDEKDIMRKLDEFKEKTLSEFINEYIDEYMVWISEIDGTKKINDFKIYIVVDLEQFDNDEEKHGFLDKSMFADHWSYEYICPIYNDKNLKEVLQESNISFDVKFKGKEGKEYVKVFPVKDKFDLNITDREEIEQFVKLIEKNKKTNLNILLDNCLNPTK